MLDFNLGYIETHRIIIGMIKIMLMRRSKAKAVNMGRLEYSCVIVSCTFPGYRVCVCVHMFSLSFHLSSFDLWKEIQGNCEVGSQILDVP